MTASALNDFLFLAKEDKKLISSEFVVSPWYHEGNRKIKKIWDGHFCLPRSIRMKIFKRIYWNVG